MEDKRLDSLERKVDILIETTHKQDIQLERLTNIMDKNTDSLIHHEKRTTISEERLHKFEDTFGNHLNFVKGAIWAGAGICSLVVTALITAHKIGWL